MCSGEHGKRARQSDTSYRVAKHSSDRSLARRPSTEALLGQGHVPKERESVPLTGLWSGSRPGSARHPRLQVVLRQGRVSKGTSIGTLAREPCLQGVQCHPRVPKGASCRSSSRPPCQQMPQWHPRGATVSWLSDSSRIGLREIHLARAIIDYQVVSYPKGAR